MTDLDTRINAAAEALRRIDVEVPDFAAMALRRRRARRRAASLLTVAFIALAAMVAWRAATVGTTTIPATGAPVPVGLPALGTFTYEVVIDRSSPTVTRERDEYREVLTNTATARGGVRQRVGSPTGPAWWKDYATREGALVEIADGDFKSSVCQWDAPLVWLPAPPREPGGSWTSTARCDMQVEGGNALSYDRTLTGRVLGRETWRYQDQRYEAIRLEWHVNTRGRGESVETYPN